MTIKDILYLQIEDAHIKDRLGYAMALAEAHGARLICAYIPRRSEIPSYINAELPAEFVEQRRASQRQLVDQRRDEVNSAASDRGVSAEFILVQGDPFVSTPAYARYADLVVGGQPDPDQPNNLDELALSMVFSSGRPVLFVPYAGRFTAPAEHVIVAWNATRESARAVHDAMPLLQRAKGVMIYEFNPRKDHMSGAEICAHLVRHGVKAKASHGVADDLKVGEALLSAAADFNADLMVMGCYGHSRLREMVLGGATRQILRSMTCPVLFAH